MLCVSGCFFALSSWAQVFITSFSKRSSCLTYALWGAVHIFAFVHSGFIAVVVSVIFCFRCSCVVWYFYVNFLEYFGDLVCFGSGLSSVWSIQFRFERLSFLQWPSSACVTCHSIKKYIFSWRHIDACELLDWIF